nr:MAG TPA: hypothetical protein [Caudoviricetes sp.]
MRVFFLSPSHVRASYLRQSPQYCELTLHLENVVTAWTRSDINPFISIN